MPQPPAYQRAYDFTQDAGNQTNHGALNTELDALAASVNAIRQNLAIIQNDQGGPSAQFMWLIADMGFHLPVRARDGRIVQCRITP